MKCMRSKVCFGIALVSMGVWCPSSVVSAATILKDTTTGKMMQLPKSKRPTPQSNFLCCGRVAPEVDDDEGAGEVPVRPPEAEVLVIVHPDDEAAAQAKQKHEESQWQARSALRTYRFLKHVLRDMTQAPGDGTNVVARIGDQEVLRLDPNSRQWNIFRAVSGSRGHIASLAALSDDFLAVSGVKRRIWTSAGRLALTIDDENGDYSDQNLDSLGTDSGSVVAALSHSLLAVGGRMSTGIPSHKIANSVKIWQLPIDDNGRMRQGQKAGLKVRHNLGNYTVCAMQRLHGSNELAVLLNDHSITLLDVEGQAGPRVLSESKREKIRGYACHCLAADGDMCVMATQDCATIYDTRQREAARKFNLHTTLENPSDWSHRIALCGTQLMVSRVPLGDRLSVQPIEIYDIGSRGRVGTLNSGHHAHSLLRLVSGEVATGGHDGMVKLWTPGAKNGS